MPFAAVLTRPLFWGTEYGFRTSGTQCNKLPRRTVEQAGTDEGKAGLILDVETTGLDSAKDEVIELGMVKFRYGPIPADIADLTGFTDDMVAGQRIDVHAVADFASDASIVIAHKRH